MSGHNEDVDLSREELYDRNDQQITPQYVDDAVAELEADEPPEPVQITTYRRGRPSLSSSTRRSPQLAVRVPEELKREIDELAHDTGRRESDIIREALEHYLHPQ